MKQPRSTGRNEFYDTCPSPVGTIYLLFAGPLLTGLSFEKPGGQICRRTDESQLAKRQLSEYFDQGRTSFTFATAFTEGTDFEQQVWKTLSEIPYGETRTYRWVAERVGKPEAFRAVGNALGKNPIPIIFPCHRVIESDGTIGGYSSGIDRKRRLLEIEYYSKLARG